MTTDSRVSPSILKRDEHVISPWVRMLAKTVQFEPGRPTEVYHSLGQADYVAALALTEDGQIPLVRQYRPAVEAYTWELPAGLVDPNESPAQAIERELWEEAGVRTVETISLGSMLPDTGRLANQIHCFFVRCTKVSPYATIEMGMSMRLVRSEELWEMVRGGSFNHALHLAVITAAVAHGLIQPA